MTSEKTTFISKIAPYLGSAERIFIVGISVGFFIKNISGNNSIFIMQLSILGLAATYFMSAFRVIDIPFNEDDTMDFKDLLALTVNPKVLWISSAFSLFGMFVMYQNLGNEGYKQSFMIGMISIIICMIIHVYAIINGTKHLVHIKHVFYRAVPLLILDIYILFEKIS